MQWEGERERKVLYILRKNYTAYTSIPVCGVVPTLSGNLHQGLFFSLNYARRLLLVCHQFQSDYYSKCSPDLLTTDTLPKMRQQGNYYRITPGFSSMLETSFDAPYQAKYGTSSRSLRALSCSIRIIPSRMELRKAGFRLLSTSAARATGFTSLSTLPLYITLPELWIWN